MLEKTLESPLDCKEVQPVHPVGGKTAEHYKQVKEPVEKHGDNY